MWVFMGHNIVLWVSAGCWDSSDLRAWSLLWLYLTASHHLNPSTLLMSALNTPEINCCVAVLSSCKEVLWIMRMAVLEVYCYKSTVGFPSAPNDLYHQAQRTCHLQRCIIAIIPMKEWCNYLRGLQRSTMKGETWQLLGDVEGVSP